MNPFIGEIVMFGGNFAPRSWAKCDGQLMSIAENNALFSILGTTYGGDGRTTFGIPDLRGRVPVHAGTGPGLSPRPLGQKSGQEEHVLTSNEIPSHTHTAVAHAENAVATEQNPKDNMLGAGVFYAPLTAGNDKAMGPGSVIVQPTGGNQGHYNIQPYQVVTYIICLFGTYPSRN